MVGLQRTEGFVSGLQRPEGCVEAWHGLDSVGGAVCELRGLVTGCLVR